MRNEVNEERKPGGEEAGGGGKAALTEIQLARETLAAAREFVTTVEQVFRLCALMCVGDLACVLRA